MAATEEQRVSASKHSACTRNRQRTEQGSDAAGSGARVSFAENVGRLCCCELHTHTLEIRPKQRHNRQGVRLGTCATQAYADLVRKWP